MSITLVNSVKKWWPESELLSSLNVPTYAPNNGYKYVVLSLWTTTGPADAAAVWAEPTKYLPADSEFGSNDKEIRQNLKRLFKNANIKLLIGAFGSIEMPAYIGKNPAVTARMLSNFVIENDFDGVYVSWQDTRALEGGYGVDWLVAFQSILRADLTNHLIIHSPQAPYFQKNYFKDGGYHVVNERIGFTIDFYAIQFYNQGYGQYENEKTLFYHSSNFFPGTSLLEIVSGGVPKEKIIISKPVCSRESSEGGYIPASKLHRWAERQRKYSGWSTGFAFWQYENDSDGHFLKKVLKI